jgi:hypothetical protein
MKVAKGLALFELVLAVSLLVVAITTSSWPPAVIGVLLACVGIIFWRDSGLARIAKAKTWELLLVSAGTFLVLAALLAVRPRIQNGFLLIVHSLALLTTIVTGAWYASRLRRRLE